MITTNVNGNPISSGFISEIQSDSPNVIARLWYNGAVLECDIVSITVDKGSCGSNPFMIGEVVGDLLKATVKDLTTEIKGKVIEYHVGAYVNSDYEYISLGKFTVSDVRKTRYESEITAYSGIVANSTGDFNTTGLTEPTIIDLAIRLQSDLNCIITFDAGIDTTLAVTAQLEGLTDYQALQVLAICCGGYIVNTNDGNVVVKKFDATPTLNVDTGMMAKLPEIAEMPYKVRNVGVLVAQATTDNEGNPVEEIYYTLASQEYIKVIKQGTEYYLEDENGNRIIANARPELADLYFECIYITEDIFNANIKDIVGYEYYPATVGLTLGDPRLEGSDVLNVRDVDGSLYPVPCHNLIHRYKGGLTTDIKSADASDEANKIGTVPPITQRLQSMDRQTGKAQATADKAYRIADNTNQYFWFKGNALDETGAHITEVPQEQWEDPESPYYHSGGNLLARSNGIAVRQGTTEVATFGSDGATIGEVDKTHLELDFRSVKAINGNGDTYFEVSGLVDENGRFTEEFEGDGETTTFYLLGLADSIYRVTVNGTATSAYTVGFQPGRTSVIFNSAPSSGADIQIIYVPRADLLKRLHTFTFGSRGTGVEGVTSSVMGDNCVASGDSSHAEGGNTEASGVSSHAEGVGAKATGHASHSEGNGTTASGWYAHAEGTGTVASGFASHAEGSDPYYGARTIASGVASHAEGAGTEASGYAAHAEGIYRMLDDGNSVIFIKTTASGEASHAEGKGTEASGWYSHAEGFDTKAEGANSHAGGEGTIAEGDCQTVIGKYNVADSDNLLIVGNGTSDNARSNGFVVDSNGNVRAEGSVYVGCNADSTGGTKVITEINHTGTTAEITAPANGTVGHTFDISSLVSGYTGWVICYCNTQSGNVLAANYWHASATTVTAYFRNLTDSAVTTTAQLTILRWK